MMRVMVREARSMRALGEAVAVGMQAGDVVLLSGDLGAGKTQLTKGVARGLGVAEPVTSPTFNILLVHEGRLTLNHFDLYRLEQVGQLEDIDYFGTLESDGVSVVEWGDRFPWALPQDGLDVTITITGDEDREVEFRPLGPRGSELADGFVAAAAALGDAGYAVRVGGAER